MKKKLLPFIAFALGACANPYRANFNPTLDRLPSWTENRFAPITGAPRLMKTNNIREENWRLFENGYVMVGYSKFDGPRLDPSLALKEARAVGADVVLVEEKFSKSLTETATVTHWPPTERTEIREEGRVSGGRGDRQVSRRTEVTTSRGPETVYIPKQVDYYEHAATYWRKIDRPIFGALVRDLTDEQKQALQTNRGLTVRAVMTDSPAYEADLLKGDILTQINGQPVPSATRFYEDLQALAGQQVQLTILRGKNTFTRNVTLNP